VIKIKPYTLYDGHLYKLGPNGVLRQCLTPIEASKVLEEFHEGPIRGHYGSNMIVKKLCQHAIDGQLFTKTLPTCAKDVTFVNDSNLCGKVAKDDLNQLWHLNLL
jgi:hypothetical protein